MPAKGIKMKVYMISANWGHGGPGGIACDLYYTLKLEGHACRFAYARGEVPKNIDSYRIGTMLEVYRHAFIARICDNAGFLSNHATRRLVEDIKVYKPDVISIQNPLEYSLNISILLDYVRKSGIPTFWTLHDCWSFTGHYTTELCDRLASGCGHCPHRLDFPKSLIIDKSADNLKRKQNDFSGIKSLQFVAPSEWIAGLARKSYLNQYPITVINNGIDLSVFKPIESDIREKYHLEGRKILLGVASVWSGRKGSHYIYTMADMFDDSYAIVMIGKNNDPELKNNKKIIHIPQTDNREELVQWYSVADVLINPTTGDNFPTVNLEALACGTPVVTFDTGGSKESVGECGRVVEQGNIQEMVEAIKDCLEKEVSRERCVFRAKQYDKQARFMDYIELYQSVVK